jgi:hypothetical protein
MGEINKQNLAELIRLTSNDEKQCNFIFDCLKSFEDYHQSIFKMETKQLIFSYDNMEKDEYQDLVKGLDQSRTVNHNAVLASMNKLNRLAAKLGVRPIYASTVSEEQPYRREVADAVLEYVNSVILKRG